MDEGQQTRDEQLVEKVATYIETTLEALDSAINNNRQDDVSQLSSALRDQASAYRDLREINRQY